MNNQLTQLLQRVQVDAREWEAMLNTARKSYYFLNFFCVQQLHYFLDSLYFIEDLTSEQITEVQSVLYFINPAFEISCLENVKICPESQEAYELNNYSLPLPEILSRLGSILDEV